jgi:choline/glycine/proline betaine transport protein
MGTWTLFYWGWWIAWAPFVGTFIARISRGRTIREFVAGVLIVPTLATFFWFTVFGETAIALIEAGHTDIVTAVQENLPVALFVFLEKLPLTTITSSLSVLVIFTFFITSSDSGSYVIDMITSGGALNPPTIQKIYWAFMEGAIAAVLLVMGGLQALQTATINVALPFSFITVLMAYCLYKSIREEREEARALREEQIQEAISSN